MSITYEITKWSKFALNTSFSYTHCRLRHHNKWCLWPILVQTIMFSVDIKIFLVCFLARILYAFLVGNCTKKYKRIHVLAQGYIPKNLLWYLKTVLSTFWYRKYLITICVYQTAKSYFYFIWNSGKMFRSNHRSS